MAKAKAKSAVGMSQVVREALDKMGPDAKAADGWEWLKANHATLAKDDKRATFDSTWSSQRKKLTGGTTATATRPAKAKGKASKPTAPTSSALAGLTPDQLAQRLEDAAQVIRAFGGMK